MNRAKLSALQSPFASNLVGGASFTVNAEDTNAITVNVQLLGSNQEDLTSRGCVGWYLSNDANGDSIATTAANGGVAAGTDGVVVSTVTGKAGFATSEADGDIDFVITHSSTDNYYLVIVLPDGSLAVSGVIDFS